MNKIYEPLTAYATRGAAQGAIRYDQESGDAHQIFFGDSLLMNEISEEGIPYHLFEQMQESGPLLLQEWADVLGMSARTLTRYRQEGKVFSPGHSAVILRLTEILSMGMEVFGSSARLRAWLLQEVFALGGRTPMSLLSNGYGQDLVLRELYSIEHGIFA